MKSTTKEYILYIAILLETLSMNLEYQEKTRRKSII